MSPWTDLCDTCQHLWNDLQFKTHKEEEAQDLLKRYKEHLAKAKLERNYYNKNTKLAEEQRKLIDQNYSILKGKALFCSIDAVAHYSYDWAQNVHVPHSDQQIGKVYILVLVKCICLVSKMKQSASKLIIFLMKMNFLERVQMVH